MKAEDIKIGSKVRCKAWDLNDFLYTDKFFVDGDMLVFAGAKYLGGGRIHSARLTDVELYKEPKKHFDDLTKIDCPLGDCDEDTVTRLKAINNGGNIQRWFDSSREWLVVSIPCFDLPASIYRLDPEWKKPEEFEIYYEVINLLDMFKYGCLYRQDEITDDLVKTGEAWKKFADGRVERIKE